MSEGDMQGNGDHMSYAADKYGVPRFAAVNGAPYSPSPHIRYPVGRSHQLFGVPRPRLVNRRSHKVNRRGTRHIPLLGAPYTEKSRPSNP